MAENRKTNNHILYGCIMDLSNDELYHLSQKIINSEPGAFIERKDADDYDLPSEKFKQFEMDLGICHQEQGLPWDRPVPENHIVVDFDIPDKNGEKKDGMHVHAAANTLTYLNISEKKEEEEK